MKIEVNVERKFIVNGKEYNSLEEIPNDLRQAVEKTMIDDNAKAHIHTETKIVFNGKEYESIEAMPYTIRQVYEKVLKAVAAGKVSPEIIAVADTNSSSMRVKNKKASPGYVRAIESDHSFSLSAQKVIIGLILLVLILGLYFLICE